jgi:tagatose-1,6-bisphosphate aldolase non-catalytic subunit AgaZ/GatZ
MDELEPGKGGIGWQRQRGTVQPVLMQANMIRNWIRARFSRLHVGAALSCRCAKP